MSEEAPFDYEAALWGRETVSPGERSIAGFRLREALAHLPVRGRALEVGCGAGRFVCALADLRPELALVGADVSRAALGAMRARGTRVEARHAGSEQIPAEDGEFDAVLAFDVLEHVDDPERMLREVHRVIAPGGVFHLHAPCEASPLCAWRWLPGQKGERGLKRRFGGHVQRFTRRELLDRVEAAGFEILRVRNSLHLIGNLADLAAFVALAARGRLLPAPGAATTGDLVAHGHRGGSLGARLVRAADALLWAEARLLARVPSWSLHVSARRREC